MGELTLPESAQTRFSLVRCPGQVSPVSQWWRKADKVKRDAFTHLQTEYGEQPINNSQFFWPSPRQRVPEPTYYSSGMPGSTYTEESRSLLSVPSCWDLRSVRIFLVGPSNYTYGNYDVRLH